MHAFFYYPSLPFFINILMSHTLRKYITLIEAANLSLDTVPPPPGTTPIPDGYVRLYHQTTEENLASIIKHGLNIEHARGIEGPRAVYASKTGFYGDPESRPTLEFMVPTDKFDDPFVLQDVPPDLMIAAHLPWHARARYILDDPKALARTLAGGYDDLTNPEYQKAVQYVKQINKQ